MIAILLAAATAIVPVSHNENSCVTVAVDFGTRVEVRCAPPDSGNARVALERAGFDVKAGEGLGGYGDPAYVCRVEGVPAGDPCTGHTAGRDYWKVWRVGIDPLAWRGSGTGGGPGAVKTCPGSLVGFSYGVDQPRRAPESIMPAGWLPPHCP
ncbi:hypothetical protein SAMN05421504_11543 [Amycolatopsis xylanica]|uniref:Uncharacterized protein n=1 Tax=Amycolatopsis xylanica TaxID=589385 RepID=A0A1H3SRX4_9PSEU|nr:hypothetical protein [Amycolatopsis xylanica]SDZ40447.1 hypothetical protein SAMN05421504_11543 [Amycolatopsis xylanica]